MAEIVFERTCNYWIDAGIVGLYDTLNKSVPSLDALGGWPQTIKKRTAVSTHLSPEHLKIEGEEPNIDLALSYAFERVRKTLYDVSSEKQFIEQIKHGRIKQQCTVAGDVIVGRGKKAGSKDTELTYFNIGTIEKIRSVIFCNSKKCQFSSCSTKDQLFLPIKSKNDKKTCMFCGYTLNESILYNKANDFFKGDTEKSSPFVEGINSNLCFHSSHEISKKCWKCGFVTFFAPSLLFYRRNNNDTYYILPYISGSILATYQLYRSLSGKRGLSKVTGSDHSEKNYESHFKIVPRGIPVFTLSFYYDLCERLLPTKTARLLQASQNIGLIDENGTIFQTALFLKRDSGKKSFIIRETTIDRSAYFIKLFAYLKQHMDEVGRVLHLLMERTSDSQIIKGKKFRRSQLQRLSVIRASQALTEGRNVYRFLLAILLSDLKEDTARPYDVDQITSLFQKYDQWLFKKEDETMANIVEQAKNSGWNLSQDFWKRQDWNEEEKKNLIKRYYYSIERAPSPEKFLEQIRHAWKKAYLDSKEPKNLPKEMEFHDEDLKVDIKNIKKFEAYRVYFLAGMLNGLLNKRRDVKAVIEDNNVEEVSNNE